MAERSELMNAVKCPCCKEWTYEDEIVDARCAKCDSFSPIDEINQRLYDDYLRMQDDEEDYSPFLYLEDWDELDDEWLVSHDDDDDWMIDYHKNTL